MQVPTATAQWIMAIASIGLVSYWLRDTLAPFMMALILWIAIAGLARAIGHVPRFLPSSVSLAIALILVLGFGSLVIYVLARNVAAIIADAGQFQPRFEALIHNAQTALGWTGGAWTLERLVADLGPATLLTRMGGIAQSIAGNTTLILIDLLFIFPAAATFQSKLPQMLPRPDVRNRAEVLLTAIRSSVERYLLVQTAMSLLISSLSYATLVLIGLDHPLFWACLIFVLNYIPTVGSIVAVALPTLFAVAQLPDWRFVGAVALGLHIWQFSIGTFVQPRITGASLNLSAIVVVLSLTFWGTLWGLTGVFLAAPMTVLVMIVLEQFPQTHWIAVLLSSNGRPLPNGASESP